MLENLTKEEGNRSVNPVLRALLRARIPIITLGLTYALAVGLGMVMAHSGNSFALQQRDAIVGAANKSDPSSLALQRGDRLGAALSDFARNLLLGGATDTVSGIAVVIPYGVAIYRGWVGGIVSVDGSHNSRLSTPDSAIYYLVALTLQLIPYTLAGGAGINLGLAYLRPRGWYAGARWLGFPIEALRDTARIYVLIVPLYLIAALWEFLRA